jgi:hypothetical protein
MKNIILIFCLTFATIASFSQQPRLLKLKSFRGDYATKVRGEWVFSKPEDEDIDIIINMSDQKVYIDNRAQSSYQLIDNMGKSQDRLTQSPYTKFETILFSAVDNKYKNCQIAFVIFDGYKYDFLFNVIYGDVWFRFYIHNSDSSLDRFFD